LTHYNFSRLDGKFLRGLAKLESAIAASVKLLRVTVECIAKTKPVAIKKNPKPPTSVSEKILPKKCKTSSAPNTRSTVPIIVSISISSATYTGMPFNNVGLADQPTFK
jgi:hypothetical protein